MKSNRRVNTKPEQAVRNLLHGLGYRFRKDFRFAVNGTNVRPDIVFPRRKVAVFIDGCWWHSCPVHGHTPKTNLEYWIPKLERNRTRDKAARDALQKAGWRVIRIWEHVSPAVAAQQIQQVVESV